jgi:hypothetical protein
MKQIEKYKGLLDMINGGGANAEGDKFQGGGLLSILANALATPRGSEDRAKEEALAGLLGNTRPNMRPNRPAPADPAQGMSLNAGPAMQRMPNDEQLTLPGNPSGPIDDGLGPMPQRLQGDPSLGFNPANAAPVQPSAPSYTQPFSMQTPASQSSQLPAEDPLSFESFTNHVINNYDQGFSRRMLSNADQYEQAYDLFVRNGGRLTP